MGHHCKLEPVYSPIKTDPKTYGTHQQNRRVECKYRDEVAGVDFASTPLTLLSLILFRSPIFRFGLVYIF